MSTAKLQAVQNQPYHHYLGLQKLEAETGHGRLQLVIEEQLINPAGALHGGVLYSVLDVVSYLALLSQLEAKQEAVTHDIHVSVMRAAKLGQQLNFSATLEKLGKRLAFIEAKARCGEQLIASARVTKSIISP